MIDDFTTILQKEFSDKKLQVDTTVPEFQEAVEKDNNPMIIKNKPNRFFSVFWV